MQKPRKLKRHRLLHAPLGIAVAFNGCSLYRPESSATRAGHASALSGIAQPRKSDARSLSEESIANPLAKTIRFEGQELVLGNGEFRSLPVEEFQKQIDEFISKQQFRSAKSFIAMHRSSARRWIVREWSTKPNDRSMMLTAETLDSLDGSSSMTSLLGLARSHQAAATAYNQVRNVCEKEIASGSVAQANIAQLNSSAEALGHPLLQVESARLEGISLAMSEQEDAAIAAYRRGFTIAQSNHLPSFAAEMALMICDAGMRKENMAMVAESWNAAVTCKLSSICFGNGSSGEHLPEIDAVFWEQADRLKPVSLAWPNEIASAVSPWAQRLGMSLQSNESVDSVLWASIGQFQLVTGQPELALISLKRAESDATVNNRDWLRIAQARCIAAQGQTAVAATLLSGPAASTDPTTRVAALATLGSIKLQSGAFQQGAQIIHQALASNPNAKWPGRVDAEADLANAKVVLGELEQALDSLHATQQKFLVAGRWKSLVQSLENESRLLEAEGRTADANRIKERIAEIEQT